ncbi:MAG: aspartate aminotransferase family protein, partial [Acidobacteriota bacterium]|nr:aspartate aminotransferase family protein [Acidobacteriota bacterium]
FRVRAVPGRAKWGAGDEALDELNQHLLESVNETGAAYLTQTRLRGRLALRIAVGNVLTTERHLARAWELVRRKLTEAS